MKTIVRSAFMIGALALTVSACKKDKKTIVEEPTPAPVVNTFPTSLYIAGGFKGADVTSATVQSILPTDTAGVYYGYINIDSISGSTKTISINPAKSATGKWGADGAITTTAGPNFVSTGAVKEGGSDISVPTFGTYLIEVNLNTKKVKVTLSNWGLIGSATTGSSSTGWNNSIKMSYNEATKKFEVKNQTLTVSATEDVFIKFRPNNNWAWTDYGTPNVDKSFVSGTELKQKGEDIKITAGGSYDLSLDLSVKGKAKATVTKL